eukprot:CAMPEP_0175140964 /NCGR_PEP_ID=MMETSP0087-20121206/11816_1 /TAXON_ID=136419 /ORGANISM="Unknown Unknown, Strain D1" /LENGTH=92 /DNA_ID=CAMNT_0016424275 /DNA_START=85 /DNA_END=363 /DNA_ORIENTATION=-
MFLEVAVELVHKGMAKWGLVVAAIISAVGLLMIVGYCIYTKRQADAADADQEAKTPLLKEHEEGTLKSVREGLDTADLNPDFEAENEKESAL